ncbi:MAG: NYN domain-containing protein [Acidimicrobiia bacterium]|nr:NYN domain-containing protein [Acidimicrobiia bacterium]
MPQRLKVFIDYQNAYMRARDAFGDETTRRNFTFGQFNPQRLGIRLRQMAADAGKDRTLDEVRVYRGEPDAKHNPTGQAACQRQVRYWSAQPAVQVFTRPLDYRPTRWENNAPAEWDVREKGIDVMLAVDLVVGAIRNEYDVAILMSADTDLLPAAEAVIGAGKWIEFAAWRPDVGYASHLRVQGRRTWCHHLRRRDFEIIADPTDYTKPLPRASPTT